MNILDSKFFPLRNFTGLKFVLVTTQLCLLWFGVNFCMSYDFSLTSKSCQLWFGVSFACHVISLLVSFSECRRTFSNLNLEHKILNRREFSRVVIRVWI